MLKSSRIQNISVFSTAVRSWAHVSYEWEHNLNVITIIIKNKWSRNTIENNLQWTNWETDSLECVVFIVLFGATIKRQRYEWKENKKQRRRIILCNIEFYRIKGKLWKLIKIYMMNGVVDKLCLNISTRNLICFGLAILARCVGEYNLVFWNNFCEFILFSGTILRWI